jgi:class 3 adenylate cyclase
VGSRILRRALLQRLRRCSRRPALPPREVRKIVSVLFADVVGSTALGEGTHEASADAANVG